VLNINEQLTLKKYSSVRIVEVIENNKLV